MSGLVFIAYMGGLVVRSVTDFYGTHQMGTSWNLKIVPFMINSLSADFRATLLILLFIDGKCDELMTLRSVTRFSSQGFIIFIITTLIQRPAQNPTKHIGIVFSWRLSLTNTTLKC